MAIGDLFDVEGAADVYALDVGLYDTPEYGSVYVIDADRPALVDTGLGANVDVILAGLDELGIAREDLAVLAPTHVHLDHAGGAGRLAEACPNAEVVAHEIGAPHLVDPGRLWEGTKRVVGDRIRFYAEPVPVPESRLRPIEDGDVVDLGDRALSVHHAPGHAPHQAVFADPATGAAFTADAAGIYVPALDEVKPTSPPPNFDAEKALSDVEMIRSLDPSVLCFGHFGPVAPDGVLADAAATLREWVDAIEDAREVLGDDEAVVERFVARNDLRAVWGEELAASVVEMDVRGVLGYLDRRDE